MENVREELDAPGEFFFDHNTRRLYVWFNTSDPDAPNATAVEIVTLSTLFRAAGSGYLVVLACVWCCLSLRLGFFVSVCQRGSLKLSASENGLVVSSFSRPVELLGCSCSHIPRVVDVFCYCCW